MFNLKKRLLQNKKNINIKKFNKAFTYPLSFLNNKEDKYDNYYYSNICLTMFCGDMKSEKINLSETILPKDIIEVYWYKEGDNCNIDEIPWHFIEKIKCKNKEKYVYYTAWCDYTGFDCQGGIKMYVSKSLTKIINLGIVHELLKKIDEEIK